MIGSKRARCHSLNVYKISIAMRCTPSSTIRRNPIVCATQEVKHFKQWNLSVHLEVIYACKTLKQEECQRARSVTSADISCTVYTVYDPVLNPLLTSVNAERKRN